MQTTRKPITDLIEGDLIDLEEVQEILSGLKESGWPVDLMDGATMHIAETEFAAVESVEADGSDDTALIVTNRSTFALPGSVSLGVHGSMGAVARLLPFD